jgi:Ras-related protein Rab-18
MNNPEKIPKILECGHTFCSQCIRKGICNDKIRCIFCGQETSEEFDKLIMNKCTLEECIKELLFSFKYIDEKKIDINQIDFQFSIGLMGESNGGKTSISHYFHTGETFEESPISTIGLDYHYKYVSCKKKTIKITLWDTAGQERFGSVAAGSLRGVQGLLLVFSLTPIFYGNEKEEYDKAQGEEKQKMKEEYSNKTFKTVEFWLEQFKQFNQQKDKVIYLIGNKCDDEANRIIDLDDAKYFAKEYNLKYYETSAKT